MAIWDQGLGTDDTKKQWQKRTHCCGEQRQLCKQHAVPDVTVVAVGFRVQGSWRWSCKLWFLGLSRNKEPIQWHYFGCCSDFISHVPDSSAPPSNSGTEVWCVALQFGSATVICCCLKPKTLSDNYLSHNSYHVVTTYHSIFRLHQIKYWILLISKYPKSPQCLAIVHVYIFDLH